MSDSIEPAILQDLLRTAQARAEAAEKALADVQEESETLAALDDMKGRAEKAEAGRAMLTGALVKLVNKLHVVHNSPEYQGVWQLARLHSGPYKGPKYTTELKAAEDALARKAVRIPKGD